MTTAFEKLQQAFKKGRQVDMKPVVFTLRDFGDDAARVVLAILFYRRAQRLGWRGVS